MKTGNNDLISGITGKKIEEKCQMCLCDMKNRKDWRITSVGIICYQCYPAYERIFHQISETIIERVSEEFGELIKFSLPPI